jgi:sugar (pentulose or hexulose) kinase
VLPRACADALLCRSVLEGVAYGTEVILENMRQQGFHVDNLTVAGGATKSDLWLQMHADVSNLPLILTE